MTKSTKTSHVKPIADANIAALAHEAAVAGDHEMVTICGRALTGDNRARRECARVIMAARAMQKRK